MHTATDTTPLFQRIEVSDSSIFAVLSDGRTISVPLAWSWRLSDATAEQRANHRMIGGGGGGAHWPDEDADISVVRILSGRPAWSPRRDGR